jgi:hypothetical protein
LQEAIDLLEDFIGTKAAAPKNRTRHRNPPSQRATRSAKLALSRAQVKARLTPSSYFLVRGFSQDVLDRFNVGHSPFLRTSIVPIYDDDGQICVGFLKRSEKPVCPECGKCHNPSQDCISGQRKWAISKGCPKSELLYNYVGALRAPFPSVLLVEGPGDVWRAEETGFPAASPFGTGFSQAQADKLASL